MSFSVKNTTIYLTRGDTLNVQVNLTDSCGNAFTPSEGDSIRFALKEDYYNSSPLIVKNIPIETMILHLDPSDTKSLDFGTYVFDIEYTDKDGTVDTFITKGKFKLTEEVH